MIATTPRRSSSSTASSSFSFFLCNSFSSWSSLSNLRERGALRPWTRAFNDNPRHINKKWTRSRSLQITPKQFSTTNLYKKRLHNTRVCITTAKHQEVSTRVVSFPLIFVAENPSTMCVTDLEQRREALTGVLHGETCSVSGKC